MQFWLLLDTIKYTGSFRYRTSAEFGTTEANGKTVYY